MNHDTHGHNIVNKQSKNRRAIASATVSGSSWLAAHLFVASTEKKGKVLDFKLRECATIKTGFFSEVGYDQAEQGLEILYHITAVILARRMS